jgi:hypothetical protein
MKKGDSMKINFLKLGALAVATLLIAFVAALGFGFIHFDPHTIAGLFGVGSGGAAVLGLGLTTGAAPGSAPQGGQNLYPFRENTRQKIGTAGNDLTYSLGGTQFLTLPKIGYVSKVFIRFNGTVTATSAGADTITYAKFGPWSVLRNIQLDLNSGKQTLFNLSGYELFLQNSIKRKSGRPDVIATDADFYAAPTTGSAVPLRFTLEIPVAVSDGQNFMTGLINLQAPELQMNLTLAFANALTDIGSNISTLSGTVQVAYQYYEVPDPSAVMQPYVALHKIISQPQAIGSTGDNIVEVPRGGQLMRIIHVLELNGAKSDSYDTQTLRLNKTQQVYRVDRWLAKFLIRERYGYTLPTGVICWDFQNAYDIPEESDARDMIDTERATTTESIVTVTSGATLGSNNNFIYTVREFIQVPV